MMALLLLVVVVVVQAAVAAMVVVVVLRGLLCLGRKTRRTARDRRRGKATARGPSPFHYGSPACERPGSPPA